MPQAKSKTKTKLSGSAPKGENKYFEGTGRRKRATARVRIYPADRAGGFQVNGLQLSQYFKLPELVQIAEDPLNKLGLGDVKVNIQVKGGGSRGQAEASRLGLARALVEYKSELRGQLRALGYLTRDPREKERKKPGLKKARRAAQWQKR